MNGMRKVFDMKKNVFVFLLIPLFFLIPSLWGISINDFDKIVDFSITLEKLSMALETDTVSHIDKTKFVILDGTASVIRPTTSAFYYINSEDIVHTSSFINKFKKATHKVSQYLLDQFSPELREEIQAYKAGSDNESKLLKDMLNVLKKIHRKESIYDADRFAQVSLDSTLKEYAQRDLGPEEQRFVNRLLMESAYPGDIKTIAMEMEIMYGIWIGYDEVKSYKSIIYFKGIECFKIFNRKKINEASREMIRLNSPVLIIAQIIDVHTFEKGEKGWKLEGHYIREVRK